MIYPGFVTHSVKMGQTCTNLSLRRRGCRSKRHLKYRGPKGDEICMICYTDPLSSSLSLILNCGHVYHHSCLISLIENKWVGSRITFSFMTCPICKAKLCHPYLEGIIRPYETLYREVSDKALDRLKFERLDNHASIKSLEGPFYKDPLGFALDRYAYYLCSSCETAYFGGERRCESDIDEDFSPEDCICEMCKETPQVRKCKLHGTDYIEYKCRYCCSIAVLYCFGNTHFCHDCHECYEKMRDMVELPTCPAGPVGEQLDGSDCPLGIKHPPTGEEFAIGCGMCHGLSN